jgi:hypothetical protein
MHLRMFDFQVKSSKIYGPIDLIHLVRKLDSFRSICAGLRKSLPISYPLPPISELHSQWKSMFKRGTVSKFYCSSH